MIELLIITIFGLALLTIVAGAVFNTGFREAIFTHGTEDEIVIFGVLSAKGAIFVVVLTMLTAALFFTFREILDSENIKARLKETTMENQSLSMRAKELEQRRLSLMGLVETSSQKLNSLNSELKNCGSISNDGAAERELLALCESSLGEKSEQLNEIKVNEAQKEQIVFVDILEKFVEKDVGDTGFSIWVSDVSLFSEKVDLRFKRKGEDAEYVKLIDRRLGKNNGFELDETKYSLRVLGADPARNSASVIITKLPTQ